MALSPPQRSPELTHAAGCYCLRLRHRIAPSKSTRERVTLACESCKACPERRVDSVEPRTRASDEAVRPTSPQAKDANLNPLLD